MKRAQLTGACKPLKVTEAPVPEPPSEGLLIKTTYAGICHTDLHFIEDKTDIGGGKVLIRSTFLGDKYVGVVPGHEIGGEILAFGENAKPNGLKIGDKVLIFPWIGCETCNACKVDCSYLCENNNGGTTDLGLGTNPGGYATHVPVPKCEYAVPLPESIPMDVACTLPCSAITAYGALTKVDKAVDLAMKTRGTVNMLVIGAGGLGLWCVTLARLTYPKAIFKITCADIGQDKLDLAKESGSDVGVLLKRDDKQEDTIAKLTKDGLMDVAFDFVGHPSTADTALNSLHKGGALIVVGLHGGGMPLSLPMLTWKAVSLSGTRTNSLQSLKEVVAMLDKAGSSVKMPSVETYKLDDVNIALDNLRAGKVQGRAVFKF